MGGSSGQQPVTQQTTQTKDPWGPAQPYLQSALGGAMNLYQGGQGYIPYSGPTQAPFDPLQNQAIGQWSDTAWQEAAARGSVPVQAARNLGLQQIQNYGLSPEMQNLYQTISTQENPYLQGTINAQMDKVNAAMSGAGRYGSGLHQAGIAQAIAPTLAQDYARRQGMQADILGQGLQRAGQWSQAIPALDQARFDPARDLLSLGGMRQQREQALLADAAKLWNASQARDWEQLARFNAIVGGAGGLGGQQVTLSPGATQPSTTQRLLGGAMAGAGMGSMFGPVGMGVGALGGGLLGMM